MKTGVQIIEEERQRQILVEGWTPEHDDTHTLASMTMAAISYAVIAASKSGRSITGDWNGLSEIMWPVEWDKKWWKPTDNPIRNLAKAGALIAA